MHRFFAEYMRGITKFVRSEGKQVASLTTEVGLGDRGQAGTIGTAFDYRLRLHLGFDTKSNVIQLAPYRMMMLGSGLGREVDMKWFESIKELLQVTPKGNDETLAKISVILAWLDQGFRGSPQWPDGMKAIAETAAKTSWTWQDIVWAVESTTSAEITELMQLALDVGVPEGETLCAPEFAGSKLVGGADADLIIDECIYDVKTTVNPRPNLPQSIRQILGYVLLDWIDQYELDRIGMYFSRQGKWMSWSIPDVVSVAASYPSMTVSMLREEFREWAEKNRKD